MATLTSQPYLRTKTDYSDDRTNTFQLQRFLQKISETDADIPFLNTDGIYGDETTEAVRKYQEKYNLPQTGVADYETWESIYELYRDLMELTDEALPLHIYPIEIITIKQGDNGDAVIIIQLLLNNFANRYTNLNKVRVTGQYTGETADAVRNFQNISLLEPTGEVNRPTWNEMVRLYRAFLINE